MPDSLIANGLSILYDENILEVGNSIKEEIKKGLRRYKFIFSLVDGL